VFNFLYRLRHFFDSEAKRKSDLRQAKKDLVLVARETQLSISHEPATKQVHDVYNSLDKMCKSLEE
jgi:hypothetical protein